MEKELATSFVEHFAQKYLQSILPVEVINTLNEQTSSGNDSQRIFDWDKKVTVLHHWEAVIDPLNNSSISEYIKLLKQALFENKKVWLGYEGKEKKFLLNPFGLVVRDQQYFIVGSQWEYTNPLLYAVRSINHINISEQSALSPAPDFDLNKFSKRYLNHTANEKPIDRLVIEFPNFMRSYVEAYPLLSKFHHISTANEHCFELIAEKVENSKRLQQWLSGFHGNIYIKEPEFLREIINRDQIDNLTKLYNRNFFDYLINREVQYYLRNSNDDYHFSLLALDIDRFKKINDKYGHNLGDEVLKKVAKLLRQEEGIRYGGEEFYVLLPGKNSSLAYDVAERIRKEIENINFNSSGTEIKFTASIGVVELTEKLVNDCKNDHTKIIEAIKNQADMALYKAKKGGRNRSIRWQESESDQWWRFRHFCVRLLQRVRS